MAGLVNRMKQEAVNHELVCSLLSYDPKTGVFLRKYGRGATAPAGFVMPNGYRVIRVNYHKFLAHRLAWFISYKEWPSREIDHINRDRDDNRLVNLRDVSRKQNSENTVTALLKSAMNAISAGDDFSVIERAIVARGAAIASSIASSPMMTTGG